MTHNLTLEIVNISCISFQTFDSVKCQVLGHLKIEARLSDQLSVLPEE